MIIELVNQKEQLLSIVSKLRDKLKSNEQKIESSRSKPGSGDAKLCEGAGSHDHKQDVSNTTTPVKNHGHGNHSKTTHHSTPLLTTQHS